MAYLLDDSNLIHLMHLKCSYPLYTFPGLYGKQVYKITVYYLWMLHTYLKQYLFCRRTISYVDLAKCTMKHTRVNGGDSGRGILTTMRRHDCSVVASLRLGVKCFSKDI